MIKWTKEKCQIEALKFKSRIQFFKNSNNAYNASRRHKWIDSICSHSKLIHVMHTYRHDILDEICEHMKRYTNNFKK